MIKLARCLRLLQLWGFKFPLVHENVFFFFPANTVPHGYRFRPTVTNCSCIARWGYYCKLYCLFVYELLGADSSDIRHGSNYPPQPIISQRQNIEILSNWIKAKITLEWKSILYSFCGQFNNIKSWKIVHLITVAKAIWSCIHYQGIQENTRP